MSVARNYARALLETANDQKLGASQLDQIERELTQFGQLFETSPDLYTALTNPVVSDEDKVSIAQAIAAKLGFLKLTGQFLMLVARKGRGAAFEEMSEAFIAVRHESEGATMGTVVSADPMSEEDLKELATSFTRKLGKKVVFKASVDVNLLAGLKVTVNGTTYDGSLRSQLQQLRDRLVYGKPVMSH